MATKDISDRQICEAYAEMKRRRTAGEVGVWADDILARMTGERPKVCERAMERAERRGLIDCGMWLRGGWLTKNGEALLAGTERGRC